MSAISATTAGMRDMADGTLRISFDIEPRHAQEAYALFGARGASVAIAALNLQATVAIAQAEAVSSVARDNRITGLALLAVQWCKEPTFWEWLNDKMALTPILNEDDAKWLICYHCGINSRKELNTVKRAAENFNELIREPYMKFLSECA